jgi:hypothetical protein
MSPPAQNCAQGPFDKSRTERDAPHGLPGPPVSGLLVLQDITQEVASQMEVLLAGTTAALLVTFIDGLCFVGLTHAVFGAQLFRDAVSVYRTNRRRGVGAASRRRGTNSQVQSHMFDLFINSKHVVSSGTDADLIRILKGYRAHHLIIGASRGIVVFKEVIPSLSRFVTSCVHRKKTSPYAVNVTGVSTSDFAFAQSIALATGAAGYGDLRPLAALAAQSAHRFVWDRVASALRRALGLKLARDRAHDELDLLVPYDDAGRRFASLPVLNQELDDALNLLTPPSSTPALRPPALVPVSTVRAPSTGVYGFSDDTD